MPTNCFIAIADLVRQASTCILDMIIITILQIIQSNFTDYPKQVTIKRGISAINFLQTNNIAPNFSGLKI